MHHTTLEAHINILIWERSDLQNQLTDELKINGAGSQIGKTLLGKIRELESKTKTEIDFSSHSKWKDYRNKEIGHIKSNNSRSLFMFCN